MNPDQSSDLSYHPAISSKNDSSTQKASKTEPTKTISSILDIESDQVILGYWGIRGLGQIPRYILKYIGIDYIEHRYSDFNSWELRKNSLGLDFPNLPYLIYGKVRITQHRAICRFLARKHPESKLITGNLEIDTEIDQVSEQCFEILDKYTTLCYLHSYHDQLDYYWDKFFKNYFVELSNKLGKRVWICNTKSPSLADLVLGEVFDRLSQSYPKSSVHFPNLGNHYKSFLQLEQLQKYRKNKSFINLPFNAPWAVFNG